MYFNFNLLMPDIKIVLWAYKHKAYISNFNGITIFDEIIIELNKL